MQRTSEDSLCRFCGEVRVALKKLADSSVASCRWWAGEGGSRKGGVRDAPSDLHEGAREGGSDPGLSKRLPECSLGRGSGLWHHLVSPALQLGVGGEESQAGPWRGKSGGHRSSAWLGSRNTVPQLHSTRVLPLTYFQEGEEPIPKQIQKQAILILKLLQER